MSKISVEIVIENTPRGYFARLPKHKGWGDTVDEAVAELLREIDECQLCTPDEVKKDVKNEKITLFSDRIRVFSDRIRIFEYTSDTSITFINSKEGTLDIIIKKTPESG